MGAENGEAGGVNSITDGKRPLTLPDFELQANSTLTHRMKKELWLLFAALFVAMIGFGITLPALPFFVERLALGANATPDAIAFHVGSLTAAFALTQFVFSPLWGRWSDLLGRKPLVLFGLSGFALSQALFGLGTSLPILYASRLAAGAFSAALLTTSAAFVADSLPEHLRGRGMAWRNTALSLGVVVGPVLGGLLAQENLHVVFSSRHFTFDGFSIPFFTATLLALLIFVLVWLKLPESLLATMNSAPRPRARTLMKGQALNGLLGLTLTSQFALALFEGIFALFAARELGFSLKEVGYGFAVCGIVMAVFQGGAVGYLTGRVGARAQIALGFGLTGLGLSLLLLKPSIPISLGMVGVLGSGLALVAPNLLTLIANRSGPHLGVALGLQNAAGSLGQVAGPFLGALLFNWHTGVPFALTAGGMLAVAVWEFHRLKRRTFQVV